MFKKVSGERIVAAIIDSIILSVVTAIPTAIYLFKDGLNGLEGVLNSMVDTTSIFGIDSTFLLISGIAGFALGFLYFVYIPYKWNGQTLGKKIMSIKAIDEFGNNPSLWKHTLRAIQVWDTYIALVFLPVMIFSSDIYTLVIGILSYVVSFLVFISFVLLLVKDDGRGIHDSIAGTYVVKTNIDMDKSFVEKTTQMGDWAEVDYNLDKKEKEETTDDWYE